MIQTRRISLMAVIVAILVLVVAASVGAASNSTFNQTINAGILATDIKDNNRDTVASPSITMGSQTFSFDCQTSTGTFGTNTQRVYVANPGASNSGWTLTIAATGAETNRWQNAGPTQYIDYNDAGGSGCTDSGDADSTAGQLTLDASAATLTADCTTCDNSSITLGSSAAFAESSVANITLLNAAAGSDDFWRGYLTDVDVSQTIPAETPADAYSINLTLTATAQ